MGIIETANSLSLEKLGAGYVFPKGISPTFHSARDGQTYSISLETSSSISAADMQACFELIRDTSAEMYQNSNVSWSPAKKRKEMKLPDLRYLLVKRASTLTQHRSPGNDFDRSRPRMSPRFETRLENSDVGTDLLEGFLSFMLTYEDGHEVIYCYELHLSERLRGCGLGRTLMGLMEAVGQRFAVEKAMLTVFLANEQALRFYESSGCENGLSSWPWESADGIRRCRYTKDDYSPSPTLLRSGKTKEPSYVILSKPLKGPSPARDADSTNVHLQNP